MRAVRLKEALDNASLPLADAPLSLYHLKGFKNITFFDVLVSFDGDTTLVAARDFFSVVQKREGMQFAR